MKDSINPSMLTLARDFIALLRPLMLPVSIAVTPLMSFKIPSSSFTMAFIEVMLTFFRSLLQKSTKPSPNDLILSAKVCISDFPRILSTQPPDFGTVLASCVTNVPALVAV